ncbi:c-type cytochrome [Blattabacterium cuenoti]|uniref:c-type cytochrome n=1 Tax=Blattabacterium cuenoti TaxID=1653831 RepID=UPI00163BE497|nr:c-type cytochrome [Blattabacterium cuenoti]
MRKILIFILIFYSFLLESKNIDGDFDNGKNLFKKNCTACHYMDLNKKMIGPALYGVTEKRNREWLHKWIKDNKSLRNSGDKDAIDLYKEYGNIEMNSFPQFSEKQIDDILFFIKKSKKEKVNENKIKINEEYENFIYERKNKSFLIKIFLLFFSIITLIILWILYRIYVLHKLMYGKPKYITRLHIKNFLIKILYKNFLVNKKKNWYLLSSFLGIIIVFNIYMIWFFLMKIDINKGYKPMQPIYFSHKIHSDINKIDCQYCHSNAKYGKVAGIPTINVCMSCHITINEYKGNYIEKGKNINDYNKEINKIYYTAGWNKEKMKYTDNVHPIKWIRIHNMPDFVYFDHSQHTKIGEKTIKKLKKVDIICSACHGNVKKMDQVKMHEDFTMEWCISCHRNVKVDMDNQYYKEYYKNNNIKKSTLNEIGGTECAKCHY